MERLGETDDDGLVGPKAIVLIKTHLEKPNKEFSNGLFEQQEKTKNEDILGNEDVGDEVTAMQGGLASLGLNIGIFEKEKYTGI